MVKTRRFEITHKQARQERRPFIGIYMISVWAIKKGRGAETSASLLTFTSREGWQLEPLIVSPSSVVFLLLDDDESIDLRRFTGRVSGISMTPKTSKQVLSLGLRGGLKVIMLRGFTGDERSVDRGVGSVGGTVAFEPGGGEEVVVVDGSDEE